MIDLTQIDENVANFFLKTLAKNMFYIVAKQGMSRAAKKYE